MVLLLFIASSGAGAAPLSEFTRTSSSHGAAAADTAQVKTERVRKAAPPVPPERQPDTQNVSSESEGGFWDQCLGSCLSDIVGALFGSICSGIFGGDDDEGEPAEGLAGEEVPLAPGIQAPEDALAPIEGFPYSGFIEPMGGTGKTVWLWDRPGAYLANGVTLESIPAGAEVTVTSYELFANMVWLQVSRVASDAPQGWVRQDEVREESAAAREVIAAEERLTPSATPAPIPLAGADEQKEESSSARETGAESFLRRPRWEIGVDAGVPVFSQTTIEEEYKESAYRIGVETAVFLPRSIKLGLCVDYLHANGTPLYDYAAGAAIDSPQESDLDILSIGLRIGQSITFAGMPVFFSYGLGPALFMVQESAFISTYEGDDWTGTRTDELSKWKGGGEAVISIGGVLGDRFPLSFQTRFAVIPWKGEGEKSLTLDFLERDYIAFITFGVGIGFRSF